MVEVLRHGEEHLIYLGVAGDSSSFKTLNRDLETLDLFKKLLNNKVPGFFFLGHFLWGFFDTS